MSAAKNLLCPFHCKTRPSAPSLASKGLENISQVPGNPAEVDQIHDARNVVSTTVSVLKSSVAIFRPTSSKVSILKVLFCPFQCKPRPSGVSLESLGLQYISQVPENRQDVGQHHDARKKVLVSLSVLK